MKKINVVAGGIIDKNKIKAAEVIKLNF